MGDELKSILKVKINGTNLALTADSKRQNPQTVPN
jgi:hypothetical protein